MIIVIGDAMLCGMAVQHPKHVASIISTDYGASTRLHSITSQKMVNITVTAIRSQYLIFSFGSYQSNKNLTSHKGEIFL
jgi:hypothetical protein